MNAKNYGDNSPVSIRNLNDNILLQRFILGFKTNIKDRYNFASHMHDSRVFGLALNNSQYPDFFKMKEIGTLELFYIMNPQEEFLALFFSCY